MEEFDDNLDLPRECFLWSNDADLYSFRLLPNGKWISTREYWEFGLALHCECDAEGYRTWTWGKRDDFEEL